MQTGAHHPIASMEESSGGRADALGQFPPQPTPGVRLVPRLRYTATPFIVRCHVFFLGSLRSGRKAARTPTGNPVMRSKNNAKLQLLHHGRSASDSETSDAGGMVDSQQLNPNHSAPTTPPTMQHHRTPFLMFGYFM